MTKQEYNRRYYLAHQPELCANQRAWRTANAEVVRIKDRARYVTRRHVMLKQKHEQYFLNPEKKKQYNKKYWIDNAEKLKKLNKSLRQKNKALIRERNKRYVADNPDKVRKWTRKWIEKNRHKLREYDAKRRALEVASKAERCLLQKVYEIARKKKNLKCYYCGQRILGIPHIDHIVALASGGNHGTENVAISCPKCNQSKSDKPLSEWRRLPQMFLQL